MATDARKPILYYVYRLLAVLIPAVLVYFQTVREAQIKADTVKAQSKLGYETLAATVNELKKAREVDEKELAELQGYCQALGDLHRRSSSVHPVLELPAPNLPRLPTPTPKQSVRAVPIKFDAL